MIDEKSGGIFSYWFAKNSLYLLRYWFFTGWKESNIIANTGLIFLKKRITSTPMKNTCSPRKQIADWMLSWNDLQKYIPTQKSSSFSDGRISGSYQNTGITLESSAVLLLLNFSEVSMHLNQSKPENLPGWIRIQDLIRTCLEIHI